MPVLSQRRFHASPWRAAILLMSIGMMVVELRGQETERLRRAVIDSSADVGIRSFSARHCTTLRAARGPHLQNHLQAHPSARIKRP